MIKQVSVPVPTEPRSKTRYQVQLKTSLEFFSGAANKSMNIPKKIMMDNEDPYNIGGYSSSDDDRNER